LILKLLLVRNIKSFTIRTEIIPTFFMSPSIAFGAVDNLFAIIVVFSTT